ncbi:MAG: hypothetical protein WDA20_05660 [Desulfuromonadales bacterium]
MALLAGPLAINFWVFEVLLGMLIPLSFCSTEKRARSLASPWPGFQP